MKNFLTFICILTTIQSAMAQHSGNILYYTDANGSIIQPYTSPTQQNGNFVNNNEIYLTVNAIYNSVADSYLAIFHIAQVGNSAREADSLINQRINNFKASVVASGLKESDFVVDMLSMLPTYEIEVTKKLFSKSYNEVPSGFEIQKNIHIHFRKSTELDKIITAAAMNEIYDIIKVDYYVKNQDAIYDSLRKQASDLIQKRIKLYESLGVALDGQWRLAMDQTAVFFPLDRYTTFQATSSLSLEAAKKKGPVTQITRPVSMFYNKIPYGGYDIVINPEIVEPAVQYTYNLQVHFTLEKKPEEKPVQKTTTELRYILVTPEGNTKELLTK